MIAPKQRLHPSQQDVSYQEDYANLIRVPHLYGPNHEFPLKSSPSEPKLLFFHLERGTWLSDAMQSRAGTDPRSTSMANNDTNSERPNLCPKLHVGSISTVKSLD